MKTIFNTFRTIAIMTFFIVCNISETSAQLNGFILTPSGNTDNFMKFVPKAFSVNGTNYVTGYMTMSAFKNLTTNEFTDPGIPVQKLQLQGGNILLCRTSTSYASLDINPTSPNGAILFSDFVTTANDFIHGKWGIEYENQASTGGLNFFKPRSSLTDTRINFNLFIRNDGNIGISTGDPVAKLQIADGDVFIEDIDKGIIMKSPDGRCWKGTMNNEGQLQFAELSDCNLQTGNNNIQKPESSTIKVFPNPVENILTIDLQQFENKIVQLIVFNQTGQIVKTKSISGVKKYSLDVSDLLPGVYNLHFATKTTSEITRFIKQ